MALTSSPLTKVTIELPTLVSNELNEFIPWGHKSKVISALTINLLHSLQQMTPAEVERFLGACVRGTIVFVPQVNLEVKDATTRPE